MKYIKNLEDKTQSVLAEDVAKDAAEISGLDADAVSDAVAGLNFASYLELGNAITNQDGELVRELLNISDVVPEEPIAGEVDLEEDDEHPEDQFPHDPTILCSSCGSQGYDEYGNTCITCGGKGRLTLDGDYIDDDAFEQAYGYDEILGEATDRKFYVSGMRNVRGRHKITGITKDDRDIYDISLGNNGVTYDPSGENKLQFRDNQGKPMTAEWIYNVMNGITEADNPSAPATAAPAQTAATPPSAGSSIDALAQPTDTAADEDNQEVQQSRKEIDDLAIGDEIEVADIDGQPAAGRVRNLAGPGDTLVITGKGNEEHMIRKDSILSTPMIPVQEKKQSRLDKTWLGKKNKRAERVEDKKKRDVQEDGDDGVNIRRIEDSGAGRRSWQMRFEVGPLETMSHQDRSWQVSQALKGLLKGNRKLQRELKNRMGAWGFEKIPTEEDRNGIIYIPMRNNNVEEMNEGLQFFVEPLANGIFEVRNDRGDIHDVYDSGEEAVRVAGELNAQYGDVDEDVERVKQLAGLNEVKSGRFKSKAIGSTVKLHGEDANGNKSYNGEIGTVVSADREHTFSQMVPFVIIYGIDLEDGERVYIRRENVRRVKIQETASGGATGAGAIASSPSAVGGMQSRNRSIYGQTKLRKKPAPKKRPTREEKGDGIGRDKKD